MMKQADFSTLQVFFTRLVSINTILTVFLVNSSLQTFGQQASTIAESQYQKLTTQKVGKFITNNEQIICQMEYGKFELLNPPKSIDTVNKKVKEVFLVYTAHPPNLSFQQLNTNRIKTLLKIFPNILEDLSVKWNLIRQTDCPTKEEARKLFHGFAIEFEEIPMAKIEKKTTPKLSKEVKELPPPEKEEEVITQVEPMDSMTLLVNEGQRKVKEIMEKLPRKDWRFMSYYHDSSSISALKRNMEEWKDVVTISDWTASMYPYTTQILRWHVERGWESNLKHFVFFNDGDKKRNEEKKIGKTGGIHTVNADNIMKVISTMIFAKRLGDGGDLEENDIEALLWAMKNHPEAGEFALIADNYSDVRDMSLLKKLERPVRVILGRIKDNEYAYINTQYIEIALKTNGSLHTFDNDYYTKEELMELKKLVKSRKPFKKKDNKNIGDAGKL